MGALVERLELFGGELRRLEILTRNDANAREIANHGCIGCVRLVRLHGFGESGEEGARLHRFDAVWRRAAHGGAEGER